MSMEQDERQEVYVIPQNFADSGGILGFRITWRTVIDLVGLGTPLLFINFILPVDLLIHLVIGIITLFPVAMVSFVGIDGEGLSQILIAIIRFRLRRRKLSYISFSAPPSEKSALPIGKLQSLQKKPKKAAGPIPKEECPQKVKKLVRKAKPPKTAAKKETVQGTKRTGPAPRQKTRDTTTPSQPKRTPIKPAAATPTMSEFRPCPTPAPRIDKATPSKNRGLLRGAVVETLLQKFELGEDENESTMPR